MTDIESLLQACPGMGDAMVALLAECADVREFGARVLQASVNAAMSAEADAACGAAWGERSASRVNSRNGYRARSLKTPAGDITLSIPKLREGTYYPEGIVARYTRVEASLAALVVEMYVNGVSTRSVAALASELGVASLSSSEVSRLASSLDAQVAELRTRGLSGQRFCYLWLDATYVRCRVEGRSVSQAVVTAIALGEDGRKHLVGLDLVDTESYQDWRCFLASLAARGLHGLVLVVSDDHAGLVRAAGEVFQGVAWQRCTVHLQRNVWAKVRRRASEGLVRELCRAAFSQGDALTARAVYDGACAAMRGAGEDRCADLMESARADALQYLSLPPSHWPKVRTNNVQERANREIKRRYRSVQSFPSRESLLRLVGAVMLEEDEGWQAGNRMMSPESAALAWAAPEPPAPDGSLARAIDAADALARDLVAGIVAKFGAKG